MLNFNTYQTSIFTIAVKVAKHRRKLLALFAISLSAVAVAKSSYGKLLRSYCISTATYLRCKWNSFLLYWFSRRTHNAIRENFRKINLRKPDARSKLENHSHGIAACVRSFANEFIENVAQQSGYETYSISMSTRDQSANLDGQKFYHWSKDLQCEYKDSEFREHHIVKMIDVDYYVDMVTYLRYYDNIMVFTFNPTKPGGSMANGTFNVIDNRVYCNINGGSKYNHELYYYDTDHVYVRTWYGGKLFLVETKECPTFDKDGNITYTDYKVVLLTLKTKVYGPLAWLFVDTGLGKRQLTYGAFNCTRSNELKDGQWCVYKHYSLPGSATAVSIPEKLLEAAIIRCYRSKAPAISDVERLFREGNLVEDPAYTASIFMAIFTEQPWILWTHPPIVTKYIGSEYHYQTHYPLVTEDGVNSMRVLPITIYPAAYAPNKSHNNDHSCLENRLFKVESKITSVPPFYNTCIREFINILLTPVDHRGYAYGKSLKWSLAPCDLDKVAELQNRPTQKSQLQRAKEWLFHGTTTVSAFQKSEAYDSINSPRNISNTSIDPKSRLAAYVYVLSDVIKTHHFYAFGHHPQSFSNSLHDKARNTTHAICTDYSKFDGTHSKPLHEFEVSLMLHAFPPQYHKEIVSLMTSEVNAKCFTASGIRYTNGYSRLSGSMNTSIMNTLDNALVSYISYRTMGFSDRDAYKELGVYGGDDGVNFDLTPENLERVTTKMGLSIRAEKILPQNPVYFLARCYPDIWTSPLSFCDVKRQVSKMHLTATCALVPEHIVYHRKFSSYLVTDPHTPIISDVARNVLRLLPKNIAADTKYDDLIRDHQWWSQYDSPFLTPSEDDSHMMGIVLAQMGMTPAEYQIWRDKIDKSQTIAEVLNCSLRDVTPPDVKVHASINDSTLGAPTPNLGPRNKHKNAMTLAKTPTKANNRNTPTNNNNTAKASPKRYNRGAQHPGPQRPRLLRTQV